MNFTFVENGNIDRSTRKRIRSHVMKGKNSKPQPLGTRKRYLRDADTSNDVILRPDYGTLAQALETTISSISCTIGDSFCTLTFPCKVQPYMKDLFYQMVYLNGEDIYPTEYCLPLNVDRSSWGQCLMSDEAFFHSTLAMSEVCLDVRFSREETSSRALHHLSNTYRCLSQSLQKYGTSVLSVVATVINLALHEDFRGQPSRSAVHIDALQKMVESHGGIAYFQGPRELRHKICRADIEYALHNGSTPRFYRDEFPRQTIESMLDQTVQSKDDLCIENGGKINDLVIRGVFLDLMSVSLILDRDRSCFRLEPLIYQEILISVVYRLLHRCPLADDRLGNGGDNAYQLSILALMTTLLFQHGRRQRISYALLAKQLRNAIENMESQGLMGSTVFLWSLFIGGISVFHAKDRDWLHPQIRRCLLIHNIDDWEHALQKIRELPWFNEINKKPAEELWKAVLMTSLLEEKSRTT